MAISPESLKPGASIPLPPSRHDLPIPAKPGGEVPLPRGGLAATLPSPARREPGFSFITPDLQTEIARPVAPALVSRTRPEKSQSPASLALCWSIAIVSAVILLIEIWTYIS